MNKSEQLIRNVARFDSKIEPFNDIINHFSNTSNRIKESKKKVIAIPPLHPAEPIYAAGALAYDPYIHEVIHAHIKGHSHLIEKATETGLSPYSNPWNLIVTGAVISGENEVIVDAYSAFCGHWDDQTSNAWRLMADAKQKPLHFWEVPRFDNSSVKWAINFLVKELEQLFDWLGTQTGNVITELSLREAIKIGNLVKKDMAELTQLLQNQIVPLPALEYYLTQVLISDLAQDPENLHNMYHKLIRDLKEKQFNNAAPATITEKAVRIFFMGDETPNIRIWNEIVDHGGAIIGLDSRLSLYYKPIKEDDPIIENLAWWIYSMLRNMPTTKMVNKMIPFIKQQKPHAVILGSIAGSKIIPGSGVLISQIIQDELGVPVLNLEDGQLFAMDRSTNKELKDFIENLRERKNRG